MVLALSHKRARVAYTGFMVKRDPLPQMMVSPSLAKMPPGCGLFALTAEEWAQAREMAEVLRVAMGTVERKRP